MNFFKKRIKKGRPQAWALIWMFLIVSAGSFGCVAVEEFSRKMEEFSRKAPSQETSVGKTYSESDRSIMVSPSHTRTSDGWTRFALVIGNSRYRHVPALANPKNDARDMKNALVKRGFTVKYLADARDVRTMIKAVGDFGDRLSRKKNSVGLFYYAGHAVQVKNVNYLVPVNASIRNESQVEYDAFNVDRLLSTLEWAGNHMNIIILDACRDNPFSRGFSRSMGRGRTRGLAQMKSPTGTFIAFATAPGTTAEDGRGRNGTFTKHLLKHIHTPNVKIEDMFKRVRNGVIEETRNRQVPWESSCLRGDFYFGGCLDHLEEARKRRELEEMEARGRREKEKHRMEIERLKREIKAYERRKAAGPAPSSTETDADLRLEKKEMEQKRREVERLNRELEGLRRKAEEVRQNRPAKEAPMPVIGF